MGGVDKASFNKGVFASSDVDAAVIIHHPPLVSPAALLFHITDIVCQTEIADITVADNDIVTIFQGDGVTAAVGIDGEAFKNHITGIGALDNTAGKGLFAFENEVGSCLVKGIAVRRSGNDSAEKTVEVFAVKDDGLSNFETGITGTERGAEL